MTINVWIAMAKVASATPVDPMLRIAPTVCQCPAAISAQGLTLSAAVRATEHLTFMNPAQIENGGETVEQFGK